ncbi:MAG: hypothetical protein M3520_12155, partial [Actinomycetota bacterium]|nr:hypothetical protein [Actinomycetota bacterium]
RGSLTSVGLGSPFQQACSAGLLRMFVEVLLKGLVAVERSHPASTGLGSKTIALQMPQVLLNRLDVPTCAGRDVCWGGAREGEVFEDLFGGRSG